MVSGSRRTSYSVTEEERRAVVTLYRQGYPVKWISREFDLSGVTIWRITRVAGFVGRQTHREVRRRRAAVIAARERGASYKDIADNLGITQGAVHHHLWNAGRMDLMPVIRNR